MERAERIDLVFKRLSIAVGGVVFVVMLYLMAGLTVSSGGGFGGWFFALCVAAVYGAVPFYLIRGLHWILKPLWTERTPPAPTPGMRLDL